MPIARLSETVTTLYAELLDQCVLSEGERTSGSFVSKNVGGTTYWYLQQSFGARKQQTYLGRDTPELRARIDAATTARTDAKQDEQRRRELLAMLTAGGMPRENAAVAQVLRVIAEAGMFRAGATLVGTLAFGCYANMLGVRFDQQSLRTADIDIAHEGVAVAVERSDIDLPKELQRVEPRFFAVPGFDPREPSTSLKVRGRDLRVDFVTPLVRGRRAPVDIPRFGIAAAPLAGLAYLIGETTRAVVLGGSGILVNVPAPGRFALHKLWVARERPTSERAKSRKDVRQASELLEVLAEDRPDEISRAWAALDAHRAMRRRIGVALRDFPTLRPFITPS